MKPGPGSTTCASGTRSPTSRSAPANLPRARGSSSGSAGTTPTSPTSPNGSPPSRRSGGVTPRRTSALARHASPPLPAVCRRRRRTRVPLVPQPHHGSSRRRRPTSTSSSSAASPRPRPRSGRSPSGQALATLAVRVHGAGTATATSVPVAVWDPPAWVETLDAATPLVVVGRGAAPLLPHRRRRRPRRGRGRGRRRRPRAATGVGSPPSRAASRRLDRARRVVGVSDAACSRRPRRSQVPPCASTV